MVYENSGSGHGEIRSMSGYYTMWYGFDSSIGKVIYGFYIITLCFQGDTKQ